MTIEGFMTQTQYARKSEPVSMQIVLFTVYGNSFLPGDAAFQYLTEADESVVQQVALVYQFEQLAVESPVTSFKM